MDPQQQKRERNRKIADACQEAANWAYKIHRPGWNARAEALKALAPISSASIVLSVTFSRSLLALTRNLFWRYLLLFTFAMFVLSLLSALASLWLGIRLHEMEARMLYQRKEIYKAIEQIDLTAADVTEPFDPILNRVNKPIETRDQWSERLTNGSFICFILAILSLSALGFRLLLP